MKLGEMREVLRLRGIQLTKSLGQNFLHDHNQLKRIIDAAELTKEDKVLEIGPGLGPLTELLLENAGEVLAIEQDKRLVDFLSERFNVGQASSLSPFEDKEEGKDKSETGATPDLQLLHDDAVKWLKSEMRDWREWKVVSNLPYSVASPIFVELACGQRAPKRIVATLQQEVAHRLMAQADDDDFGVLTLLVQLDYKPRDWFKIPPECFFPEPGVDSACVILKRREQPLLPEDLRPAFKKIVKRAFSQRRKMMLKLLKSDWPEGLLKWAFAELKISPQERAEKLTLEQFVGLTNMFAGPEEVFDVVNEQDEVIDRKCRAEVHARGLLHRAIHVLVFNSRGEIFLQKRSMKKDRQPGVWDSSCSGHVDSGEDYDETAVRELQEEIGLKLDAPPQKLFKINACPETDAEFVWVYRCQSEGPFQLHPDEIETGGWFTPDKVSKWINDKPEEFATAFMFIWKRFISEQV